MSKSRLNENLRCVNGLLNALGFLLGAALIYSAYWVSSSDYYALRPEVFRRAVLVCVMCGFAAVWTARVGLFAVVRQTDTFGVLGGRSTLKLTQLLLLGLLGVAMYAHARLRQGIGELERARRGSTSHYPPIEQFAARHFDAVFFERAGADECGAADTIFWSFVDESVGCPATMGQSACGCDRAAVGGGGAASCPQKGATTSPYAHCRAPLADFAVGKLRGAATKVLYVAAFEAAVVLVTLLLCCYHPRLTDDQIANKLSLLHAGGGKMRMSKATV